MGNIADILANRNFDEPPEVKIIKEYIWANYQEDSHITIREKEILIGVKSAAMAGSLRMQLYELKDICGTDKRLIIRIGR